MSFSIKMIRHSYFYVCSVACNTGNQLLFSQILHFAMEIRWVQPVVTLLLWLSRCGGGGTVGVSCLGLSMQSLDALPRPVWVFSRYSRFPPHSLETGTLLNYKLYSSSVNAVHWWTVPNLQLIVEDATSGINVLKCVADIKSKWTHIYGGGKWLKY